MSTRLGSLAHRSLAQQVQEELRLAIVSGSLAPGSAIVLREVARQLGVSIIPVREALLRLHQEGLVLYEPQRGFKVPPLSLDEVEDLYSVRIVLEGLAIEKACRVFNKSWHEHFTKILDEFEAAALAGRNTEARSLHRKFHLELYSLAGSTTLDRLIPPLLDASERYRQMTSLMRGAPQQRRLEHQAILDACLQGSPKVAREALAEHLWRTVELLRSRWFCSTIRNKPLDDGS